MSVVALCTYNGINTALMYIGSVWYKGGRLNYSESKVQNASLIAGNKYGISLLYLKTLHVSTRTLPDPIQ